MSILFLTKEPVQGKQAIDFWNEFHQPRATVLSKHTAYTTTIINFIRLYCTALITGPPSTSRSVQTAILTRWMTVCKKIIFTLWTAQVGKHKFSVVKSIYLAYSRPVMKFYEHTKTVSCKEDEWWQQGIAIKNKSQLCAPNYHRTVAGTTHQ